MRTGRTGTGAPWGGSGLWTKVGAFGIGAGAVLAFTEWNAQRKQVALLTEMVIEMQREAPPAPEVATRAESADLTAIPADMGPVAPADALQVAVASALDATVAGPVVAATGPLATEAAPAAPAALAAAPVVPTEAEERAERIETLAYIDAGVQELAAAVVAGNYDIHTNYSDAHFSGRIHFDFIGDDGSQTEFEAFIADAAERGIIAYSSSVVDAEGRVNGHILLFDLVEKVLENGTAEQQAAAARIQAEAAVLLAAEVEVGERDGSSGARYYVVEPGDSLASISLQFYGATNAFERIFAANRDQITSPDRIRIGQRLLIPEA